MPEAGFFRVAGGRPGAETRLMARSERYTLTSESVTEGHPDKVCDLIADSVLDECLEQDRDSRVACEVLCKGNLVMMAGEITTRAEFDREALVRRVVEEIGYVDPAEPFAASTLNVAIHFTRQAPEIAQGVNRRKKEDQGAGDQGIMFGYATDETPELMPLPILLAHKLARQLAKDRKTGKVGWLRPDGKTQVSVNYVDGRPEKVDAVLVSTSHTPEVTKHQKKIAAYVHDELIPTVLKRWNHPGIEVLVNPTGSFEKGGPGVDAGVTGRKIIVDTYGGAAHHGGGAFSGKDPSKVDRSAAYFCRYVARQLVLHGLAKRAELQVAYAIGRAKPMSVKVDTFGTGDSRAAEEFVRKNFDFRPAEIIRKLKLRAPIFRESTNYGHFGRKGLPWEA